MLYLDLGSILANKTGTGLPIPAEQIPVPVQGFAMAVGSAKQQPNQHYLYEGRFAFNTPFLKQARP